MFQGVKSFGAKAPAFFLVDYSGESVADYVQVWRNFQAVENDVVAGIDDDGQFGWVHYFEQT